MLFQALKQMILCPFSNFLLSRQQDLTFYQGIKCPPNGPAGTFSKQNTFLSCECVIICKWVHSRKPVDRKCWKSQFFFFFMVLDVPWTQFITDLLIYLIIIAIKIRSHLFFGEGDIWYLCFSGIALNPEPSPRFCISLAFFPMEICIVWLRSIWLCAGRHTHTHTHKSKHE